MPERNYQNTQVYKIVCKDLSVKECYVGHTTNWNERWRGHKDACKKKNFKVYQFIRDNGGIINWEMIEIEKYPCKDKYEAHARERYWVEQLQATLNKKVPGRTQKEFQKEYRENNKEKIKEKDKKYYQNNKEKIKEKKKEYRENNKEKIKEKVRCELCDCDVSRTNFSAHNKSNKHYNEVHKKFIIPIYNSIL